MQLLWRFDRFLKSGNIELGQRLLPMLHLSRTRFAAEHNCEALEFVEAAISEVSDTLVAGSLEANAWRGVELSDKTGSIPGMVCEETRRYYAWLAQSLSGMGEIVEFGSWLGSSTCTLAESLASNPRRDGRKVHAFDSFVWEEWMVKYWDRARRTPARRGQSYLESFRAFCEPWSDVVVAHACDASPVDSRQSSPTGCSDLRWDGSPIEILIYDMGPDFKQIEHIWHQMSGCLISGQSIVVFNEYGKLGSREIWKFCLEHRSELLPKHKPRGSAKGFLFAGVNG
jgi:hypothetical protein